MSLETRVGGDSSKATAGINILLGIWMFLSPWVYSAAGYGSAWNSWIVGAIIALVAMFRLSNPVTGRGLAWINVILGVWLFMSPWIYGYTANMGRFVNSLCVGLVVVVMSIYGASAHGDRLTGTPSQP